MNLNFKDLPRKLRVWAPPLIGIPVMLAFGISTDVGRYFLFAHHMFWIVGIILLINPVTETFWPSSRGEKRHRPPPQPSARARRRAEAHKRTAKQKPVLTSETPAERLARLQKQKEAVDQKIEKLTTKDKQHMK